ncbi:hypothetical protein JCM18750_38070 [Halostagnicola bangensis]
MALGVIEQTGTTENSKPFRLNTDSDLAKTLASSHADILEHTMAVLSTTKDSVDSVLTSAVCESTEGKEEYE